MHFVFLDEFGHIGPFVSRSHQYHKTSPVFGLAGYVMPEFSVRGFTTWFHQLKCTTFANDITASKHHPATWEKKGNELFTRGRVYKTKRLGHALISQIRKERGNLFFHGIQKHTDPKTSNPVGLYYTVLSHTIRALDQLFDQKDDTYLIVIDEHQARLALLESAMRTMYGANPARRMLQAPFQAESHLYPTIQAADWIAALVGPLWAHRVLPSEFSDQEWAERYFGRRIEQALAPFSRLQQRQARFSQLRLPGLS
jgi:hypothetical protein